ncbi:MAG: hypothetical protein OQK54_04055 [Gammaproteobacteria bacterium]|nr:hypothetical protein [Gammaproteobacteria bacterium]
MAIAVAQAEEDEDGGKGIEDHQQGGKKNGCTPASTPWLELAMRFYDGPDIS